MHSTVGMSPCHPRDWLVVVEFWSRKCADAISHVDVDPHSGGDQTVHRLRGKGGRPVGLLTKTRTTTLSFAARQLARQTVSSPSRFPPRNSSISGRFSTVLPPALALSSISVDGTLSRSNSRQPKVSVCSTTITRSLSSIQPVGWFPSLEAFPGRLRCVGAAFTR